MLNKQQQRRKTRFGWTVTVPQLSIGDCVLVCNDKLRGKHKIADKWESTINVAVKKSYQFTWDLSTESSHEELYTEIYCLPVAICLLHLQSSQFLQTGQSNKSHPLQTMTTPEFAAEPEPESTEFKPPLQPQPPEALQNLKYYQILNMSPIQQPTHLPSYAMA